MKTFCSACCVYIRSNSCLVVLVFLHFGLTVHFSKGNIIRSDYLAMWNYTNSQLVNSHPLLGIKMTCTLCCIDWVNNSLTFMLKLCNYCH